MSEEEREGGGGPYKWSAFTLYDPTTMQRIGSYWSKEDMTEDVPGWEDEGYIFAPCEIVIVKAKAGNSR